MKTPKLSEEEKRALRNDARAELLRMENILQNEETTKLLDKFKNKFNLCETAYKVLFEKHQRLKGKAPTAYLNVSMTQVPHVMNFAGYNIDNAILNNLFGAKKDSVKKLRNAVTHGLDERAISEITRREDELFGYMDNFLSVIRNADNIAA